MLVALVITALIVSSVYVAFNAGTKSWQVGDTMMQKYQNARGALDFMAREISAMYMTISSIYETGLIYDGTSGTNGFRFFASVPGNSGDWDLCKVSYRYDSADREIERSFLTSSTSGPNYITLIHPTGSGHGWEPMVSNVNSLGFRWWDGSSWYDDPWDSTTGSHEGQIPEAIEITITVQDDKQLAEARTFRTVVYLPGNNQ
jgi:hypothetical protein